MRLEKEAPITQLEIEVENILVNNGYAISNIEFRDVVYKDETRYLRVGYWKQLSDKALAQLGDRIKETIDSYDDDCGTLWFYRLNH
jgi:hypothetical protein